MSWLQLHIDSDASRAESLEQALSDAGAISVTMQDNADQPVLEPGVGETPLWDATRVTAIFDQREDQAEQQQAIIRQVSAVVGLEPDQFQFETLADQDWERSWLDAFQPIQFGQRLWVCPSWQQVADDDAIIIALDPGLAFGTGTHQTTALCLEWLEQADLQGKTILDYGCGSGILAIAALLLGAKSAIAVDNDPQALVATRANAEQNGITEQQLSVCLPDGLQQSLETADISQFDIVIANILAGPLIDLAPSLIEQLKAHGDIALSGILAVQAEELMQAYASAITFAPVAQRDEWVRVSGKRMVKR